MRAFLDAILLFIGAASLSDLEFAFVGTQIENTTDDLANYSALDSVLESREVVSSTRERLNYYYLAKGVEVGSVDDAKSNIFLGAKL